MRVFEGYENDPDYFGQVHIYFTSEVKEEKIAEIMDCFKADSDCVNIIRKENGMHVEVSMLNEKFLLGVYNKFKGDITEMHVEVCTLCEDIYVSRAIGGKNKETYDSYD